MSKSKRWVQGAAALIAGVWVLTLLPMPFALAGTNVPPVSTTGWVEVSTAAQLEYIDENQSSYLNSKIELMNDIALQAGYNWIPFGGRTSGTNASGSITYSNASPESDFTGTFNGQGHEITSVVINDTTDQWVGFFGIVGSAGTVENLDLSAQVTSTPAPGGYYSLVGLIAGNLIGSLKNSFTAGSVSDGSLNGGLVGQQQGSITDSYSSANISSSSGNGGLVGNFVGGSITDSYAVGKVSGGTDKGGVIGVLESPGTFTSVYFDNQTTGVTQGVGFNVTGIPLTGITGETTTWMQTPSKFTNAGWGTSNWTFFSEQYPLLSWQVPLAISLSTSPTTVGAGGAVTVAGSVYSSGGSPLSGVNVTLSDGSAGGSWANSSLTTDTSGNFTDTWTAPNTTATATVTASVYGTDVQKQSTIQVQAFTVTYNGNGNTSGTVPTDSNTYTSSSNATVFGNTGNLTKTGYTFAGWNTTADGSGTSYKPGSKLKLGSSNVTLYAQWTADATTAPSGLVHSNVTQTGWTETWAPVGNAFSYDVYLNGNQVGSTTQNVYSYAFSNETPSTTYKVQVSSVNVANQVSTKSSSDSVTTAVYGGGGPVPPAIIQDSFTEPAQVGQKYSTTIHEVGGTSPMNWSVSAGSLPVGLSLNNQGVISGTPTTAGKYTFIVKVTDANNLSSTKQLTLTVNGTTSTGGGSSSGGTTTSTPPTTHVSVTTSKEHSAMIGHSVNLQLQAIDGQTPYMWAVVGALPKGLSLNSTTGILSGTPEKSGVHQVTVRVTGAQGTTSEKTITLDVLHSYEREVLWSGTVKNVPAIVQKEGTTETTYMPIWYVMQLLKPMSISSTWDGKHWHMTTSTKANLSNVHAGSGNTGIYLNGTLVQNVNTIAQNDPSTNKPTTFMPIWYVMQLLKRVGLQSTWSGTTWTVSK